METSFGDHDHGGIVGREELRSRVQKFARDANVTLMADPPDTIGLQARLAEIRAACILQKILPASSQMSVAGTVDRSKLS